MLLVAIIVLLAAGSEVASARLGKPINSKTSTPSTASSINHSGQRPDVNGNKQSATGNAALTNGKSKPSASNLGKGRPANKPSSNQDPSSGSSNSLFGLFGSSSNQKPGSASTNPPSLPKGPSSKPSFSLGSMESSPRPRVQSDGMKSANNGSPFSAGTSSGVPSNGGSPSNIASSIVQSLDTARQQSRHRHGKLSNDDQPPILEFNIVSGNSIGNTDNRQYASGNGVTAAAGARVDASRQIDNSMNDNRMQATAGSTINGGSVSAGRSAFSGPKTLNRRDRKTLSLEDFLTLIHVMEKNSRAKAEILFDFANIPKIRTMLNSLFEEYAEDSRITMNNMNALVTAMYWDVEARQAVLRGFNQNHLVVDVMETLFLKHIKAEDYIEADTLLPRTFHGYGIDWDSLIWS